MRIMKEVLYVVLFTIHMESPPVITPTDTNIPTKTTNEDIISEQEWRKYNIKSTKDISQVYSYVINVFKSYNLHYMTLSQF